MTAFTAQLPDIDGVTPTYNQCTATDYFTAVPNGKYILHYKNGATGATAVGYQDRNTPIPPGSSAVAGFADVVIGSISGNTEKTVYIDNASRYMDANGRINMVATTPTTLTVAIFGPL